MEPAAAPSQGTPSRLAGVYAEIIKSKKFPYVKVLDKDECSSWWNKKSEAQQDQMLEEYNTEMQIYDGDMKKWKLNKKVIFRNFLEFLRFSRKLKFLCFQGKIPKEPADPRKKYFGVGAKSPPFGAKKTKGKRKAEVRVFGF